MAEANLQDGLMDFSVDLYKDIARLNPACTCNILISPYSITAALMLVNLGADSTTEEQIRVAFGVGNISKEDVQKQYKELEDKLNAETNATTSLSIALRIFFRLGFYVYNEFQTQAEEYYGSGVEGLDFVKEPEQSRLHINEWVEQQTRNKIQNLLSPGAIGQMSSMILVNAIYFEGEWSQPFNGSLTKKSDFHAIDKTVKVEMMREKERVKYLDESGAYSVVELSYKDCNLVMDIILPTAMDGLSRMEKILNLSFMKQLSQKLNSAGREEVILGIPKFKLEDQYSLKHILRQLEIVGMFRPDANNFSPMLYAPGTVPFMSAVIHRSLIEVNEKGKEAAAATDMDMAPGCAPSTEQPKFFIADHPFMFLIRDLSSDAILFWGRFSIPPPYEGPYLCL